VGDKVCPNCGARYPADSMLTICQTCQQALAEEQQTPSAEPTPPRAAGPAWQMPPPAPPPAEPTAPPPAELPPPPTPPARGIQRVPCPNCGEPLYDTELICWRCKTRVKEAPQPQAPPPFAPPPPATSPPPGPSAGPTPQPPPYTPGAQPDYAKLAAADGLANTALWLSGAGCVVGWCLCPAISIAGLALGIKAKMDGSEKAMVPIVLGAIGVVAGIVAFIIGFLAGFLGEGSP
jgi:hypothetical protein